MRITEVMTDFRTEAHRISALRMVAPPSEQREIGYLLFNQCNAEVQRLLAKPFDSSAGRGGGDPETVKRELKRSAVYYVETCHG